MKNHEAFSHKKISFYEQKLFIDNGEYLFDIIIVSNVRNRKAERLAIWTEANEQHKVTGV